MEKKNEKEIANNKDGILVINFDRTPKSLSHAGGCDIHCESHCSSYDDCDDCGDSDHCCAFGECYSNNFTRERMKTLTDYLKK